MKLKVLILMLVLLLVGLNMAYAGNQKRIGTAGAQELRIPIGSRGTALGGSVIANTYGVESVHWNPAGLGSLMGTEVMFSHQPYIADIDINFAGIATNIEDIGTVAAAVKVVSFGDIIETTEDAPDGTGRTFDPTFSVISLSYSRILTNQVTFGMTGKFISEKVDQVNANGVAFDVGFIYNPGWNGLSLGLTIQNYGPEMSFDGRGFERSLDGDRAARPNAAVFDLPSSFNMGMAWNFVEQERNLATVTGNFVSNNYSQDVWQGGMEYTYDGNYSLRAGYNYSDQEDYLYGFSVGGGITYSIGETDMTFEYTWTETDVFDANQYFTVKLKF